MVVAGLVLVIIAVLLFLAGLFGGGGQTVSLDLGLLGSLNISPAALFLLGIAAMLILFVGLGTMRLGARRAKAHRKDRKQVDVLSRKLDAANTQRDNEARDNDRPTTT